MKYMKYAKIQQKQKKKSIEINQFPLSIII